MFTYCSKHQPLVEQRRVARRGGLYGGDWKRRAAAQVAGSPYCEVCGSEADLTADHLLPGMVDSPLRTLCRGCNSARANRSRAQR